MVGFQVTFITATLAATVLAIEKSAAVSHAIISFGAPSHGSTGLGASSSGSHAYYHAPIAHLIAAPVYHAAPIAVKKVEYEEPETPAYYEFEYSVHDEHTGDIKAQKESRKGDEVQGYYTLKDADGRTRIVHYTANKHDGFNAVVTYEGKANAEPVKVAAAAPVYYKAAPLVYKAPIVKMLALHATNSHGSDDGAASSHVSFSAPHHQYHF